MQYTCLIIIHENGMRLGLESDVRTLQLSRSCAGMCVSKSEREPTCGKVVIWVKICQTELMAESYSNSPVRANGKVFLIKSS